MVAIVITAILYFAIVGIFFNIKYRTPIKQSKYSPTALIDYSSIESTSSEPESTKKVAKLYTGDL